MSPVLWGGFAWAEEKTKHSSLYLPTSTCIRDEGNSFQFFSFNKLI